MKFVCRIGAQAGAGVMVTGRMMARCFTRGGYNVVEYPEYPSLVRGGHNGITVTVSDKPARSPATMCNLVIALNRDAVFYHKEFVGSGGIIVYDETADISAFKLPKGISALPLPLTKLIEKAGGDAQMRNTVALGAALGFVEYPFEILAGVLKDEFGRKGDVVVNKNIAAAKEGYECARQIMAAGHNAEAALPKIKPLTAAGRQKKILVAGNEAIALGAVKAGMKFYSTYPMTPASSILHYLIEHEREFNIIAKQTEDEIAAMNYIVGASFAGVRAMTGTSGGGFSLMVEAIGLAALSETPVVIVLVQRPGPSTCMPTCTEQGDLRFALHASQGEFPRVLVAPGDVTECFQLTGSAFNFAEKYQIPVIILSDKFLGESIFSTDRFDENAVKIERGKILTGSSAHPLPPLPQLQPNTRFKRYALTKDGISPRVFPGTPNGMHVATSYEHDETGFSSESPVMRKAQVDKRGAAKLKGLVKEIPGPKLYGPRDADLTLICHGSQKLPVLDALDILAEKRSTKDKESKKVRANGENATKPIGTVNVLHFTYLFPLDKAKVEKALKAAGAGRKNWKSVMIENNSTGQFAGVLKEYCDVDMDFLLLKYDGRQFFADQIAGEVEKLFTSHPGKPKNGKGNLTKGNAKGTGSREIRICEELDLEYYNPQRHGL